ncbi:MAG TPA: DUF1080 domain-containing protein, partial [Planctomycetota bacterium]|nr:DUF1080 domain-containing protein [Planctomycetota bacterium]
DGWAQETFVDPVKAATHADFRFQGEYAGEIRTDEGPVRVGVQVIARGEGRFDLVAYRGGLPGDGWDGKTRIRGKGRRDGEKVESEAEAGEGGSSTIEGGRMTIRAPDGEVVGTIPKVERKSPTLGKEPPRAAHILFDGSSTWRFKDGRKTEDGLLEQGAVTHERFGDGTLHIEFRTPFRPGARGQDRGNSGVYLQGRYEVQVLDSFGLEPKHDDCGGIYEIAAPQVPMCFPPLSWQTYDIEFREARFDSAGQVVEPARMTVWHNGVLVHENVPVERATRAALIGEVKPEPGPLYLQDHGNPVRYRNIWFLPAR